MGRFKISTYTLVVICAGLLGLVFPPSAGSSESSEPTTQNILFPYSQGSLLPQLARTGSYIASSRIFFTKTGDGNWYDDYEKSIQDTFCSSFEYSPCRVSDFKAANQFVQTSETSGFIDEYHGNLSIGLCAAVNSLLCLSEVDELQSSGKWLAMKFDSEVSDPTYKGFPANPELGIVRGSSGSYWNSVAFPGFKLRVQSSTAFTFFKGSLLPKGQDVSTRLGKSAPYQNVISVSRASSFAMNAFLTREENGTPFYVSRQASSCISLSATDYRKCIDSYAFPVGAKYRFHLQLPSGLGNYLTGHAEEVSVFDQTFTKDGANFTVEAAPTLVSIATGKSILGSHSLNSTEFNFDFVTLNQVLNGYGDKATSKMSIIELNLSEIANGCKGDPVSVVMTTNAGYMSLKPPSYIGTNFYFNLGDFHQGPDGQVNQGVFDFTTKAEFLKCWLKLPAIPESATISITANGTDVNTAITSAQVTNGAFRFTGRNVTFSTPKVNISLKVPKTITCIQRKNSKRTLNLTGISPNCPSGYKLRK